MARLAVGPLTTATPTDRPGSVSWLRQGALCLLGALGWWWPTRVAAQIPLGNGLRGDYYAGIAFAQLTNSRTDGLVNFSWRGISPIQGVAAEHFTVRWSGWLVPPVTGRYVLHLDADDGVVLWLEERELMGEWRSTSLRSYQMPVQLQAGHAYALRLDYLQYKQLAHVHLRWELPPAPAERHSWRTLWGVTEAPVLGGAPPAETIPTRYLFTRRPAAPPIHSALAGATAALGGTRQANSPLTHSRFTSEFAASATQPTLVVRPGGSLPASARAAPMALRLPPMRVRLSEVRVKAPPPLRRSRPGASRTDTLATRLAKGQALTLRTLYFAQSRADLLPPVQASLDTLAQAFAQALRWHPTLRVQVQGHTDNQGDSLLNRQLSQRRAEAVCRYLVSRGIPASCLQPVGLGGTQPIANNGVPAERPRNRRVVLHPLP
jgi:outer membrane protein OmpA-like peptidoglycan-associated protein